MAIVTIKREDCTSCTTCGSTCPEVFEEDPADGMSRIKEAFRISGILEKGKCLTSTTIACRKRQSCVRSRSLMLKSEVSKGSLLNEAVIEVCRCNRAPVDNPVPDQGTFLKNARDGFLAACKSRPIMGIYG